MLNPKILLFSSSASLELHSIFIPKRNKKKEEQIQHWIHLRIVQNAWKFVLLVYLLCSYFSSLQPSENLHCPFINVSWNQSVESINSHSVLCSVYLCGCEWESERQRLTAQACGECSRVCVCWLMCVCVCCHRFSLEMYWFRANPIISKCHSWNSKREI